MANDYILEMDHIEKTFPGVHALSDVHFDLKKGEVHALVGENGAGKSTLMKVLNGIYTKDSGTIKIEGQEVQMHGVRDAMSRGVVFIHQEISLVPYLTIAENIYLGCEMKTKTGLVNFEAMRKAAQEILDSLNMPLDAGEFVYRLTIAQQQMVEVAKAVSKNVKILVMDEPTASLSAREVDSLYDQVKRLRDAGVAIIYISHRLEELYIVCDRFTVLRDGGYVGTREVEGSTREDVVNMMVGREVGNFYAERVFGSDEVILEVKNLSSPIVKNVSFDLRKGEILGFSGLIGAGRTETMRAMLGLDKRLEGEVYLEGQKVEFKNMRDSIDKGIMLVPEDRRGQGLVLSNNVGFNIVLPSLKRIIKNLHINYKLQDEIIDEYAKRMRIRMSGPDQRAGNLSGGNQQKVVLAKWLAKQPKILILDEPTRGIDVGAKAEIYELMVELAKEGVSIIMISSELPEIINMSSRVVVMYEGEVKKIFDASEEELTQEKIMMYGAGIGGNANG